MGYDKGSDTDYGVWVDPDSWYSYSSSTRIYRTKYYPNGGWSVCKLTSGSNINNNCTWDAKCKVWYTGTAMFADEKVYFNHDGSGKIGSSGNYITWGTNGAVSINNLPKGVSSVSTSQNTTAGGKSTLTINWNDGTKTTLDTYNGTNGTNGSPGTPGKNGTNGTNGVNGDNGIFSKVRCRDYTWGGGSSITENTGSTYTSTRYMICITVRCNLTVSANNNQQLSFYPLQNKTVHGISATMVPTSQGGVSLIPEMYNTAGNWYLVLRNPTSSSVAYNGNVSIIAITDSV